MKTVTLKFEADGASKVQTDADTVATKLDKVSNAASKMNKQLDLSSAAYKKFQSIVASSIRAGGRAIQTGQIIDVFTNGNFKEELASNIKGFASAAAVGMTQSIGERLTTVATSSLVPGLLRTVLRAGGSVLGGFVGIAIVSSVEPLVTSLVSKAWEKLTTGRISNPRFAQEEDLRRRSQDTIGSYLLYGPKSSRMWSDVDDPTMNSDTVRQMLEKRARGEISSEQLEAFTARRKLQFQQVKEHSYYTAKEGISSQVLNPAVGEIGVGNTRVGAGIDELNDAVINLDYSVRQLLQRRQPVSNF